LLQLANNLKKNEYSTAFNMQYTYFAEMDRRLHPFWS